MKLGISVKPSGFVAVDPVVQQARRLRESDERWKKVESVTRFPQWKQRLLAEDHTQHPSGTTERVTL